MQKQHVDLKSLPMSEKMNVANLLGEEVGKIMNKALKKCNNMLKKYGYSVSITLNFHEIEKEEQQ